MRIKINNNRNGKIENELVKKVINFYLNELLGTKVNDIHAITVTFKKLKFSRGGSAGFKSLCPNDYQIILNSTKDPKQTYKTLAHECTHIKQYVTKELTFSAKYSRSGRRQNITTWKGRQYLRKAYLKQPWEIDARKGEKMAWNILNKIEAPAKAITKVAPAPVKVAPIEVAPVLNTTREIVISILNGGSIPNGDLVSRVLNGDTDRQKTMKVLREVFALKQNRVIEEYSEGSLIYVRRV